MTALGCGVLVHCRVFSLFLFFLFLVWSAAGFLRLVGRRRASHPRERFRAREDDGRQAVRQDLPPLSVRR